MSLPEIDSPPQLATATAPDPAWRRGLDGARANLVPGVFLQIFALGLLAAYYWHAPSRVVLEHLAALRVECGVPFDLISTALFGAIIPCLVLALRPATRHRYNLKQVAAISAYWAYRGVEISFFYQLQARLFGTGQDATTIILKTLVDEYLYCPVIAVPITWAAYTWIEHHFDTAHLIREFRRPGFYARCVLPILIANWIIWTPAVAVVYLLPTALQLPMQNIVLCFFTLLLATITRHPAQNSADGQRLSA